jgi:hypothetical protein
MMAGEFNGGGNLSHMVRTSHDTQGQLNKIHKKRLHVVQ